jgi:hypothetical protein
MYGHTLLSVTVSNSGWAEFAVRKSVSKVGALALAVCIETELAGDVAAAP